VAARGFTAPYSTFPSGAPWLRRYGHSRNSAIGDYYEHDGNWWYDALQIKVTKRLSNGCRAASVTRGRRIWEHHQHRNLYHGDAGTGSDPPPKSQKSYVAIDQPQMLNFYFNYEVPRFSFSQSGWKAPCFRAGQPTASSITRAVSRCKHRIRRAL
jgi:hypothetical protein